MAKPIALERVANCLGIFGVAAEPYPEDEDGDQGVVVTVRDEWFSADVHHRILTIDPDILTKPRLVANWVQVAATMVRGVLA